MTWIGNFYRSDIGKKSVMAVTGFILFGWILLHMVGNLKLYFPEHELLKDGQVVRVDGQVVMVKPLNAYANFLRGMLTPALPEAGMLWLSRIILLVAVILHIHSATVLTITSRKARPVAYHERTEVASTYASRTMRWGGVIILLFVIYHILHLTIGNVGNVHVHPNFLRDPNTGQADVYHNVVAGFQVWWVAAIYIIANLALGLHLFHGLRSMFDSLGLSHPKFNLWRRTFATAFALLITVANVSFPLMVLMGVVR